MLARRRPGRRRHLAVVACLLWLLGVELVPNLHVGLHAQLAPHEHGSGHRHDGSGAADGPVIRVHTGATHAHDGVLHSHPPEATTAPVQLAGAPHARAPRPPAPLDHGAHSLAHHALALQAPPPAVTHPVPVGREVVADAHADAQLTTAAPVPDAAARAPPA
ncbi:MAG TPA: hypothetical protein VM734_17800 [Kofleriaceae bacterium]|nr:hypothetical protein [Kofleriaceae bacterium]